MRKYAIVALLTVAMLITSVPLVSALTWTQTTTADFENGTKVQVDVSNDEVKLADFKKTKWMLTYVEKADGENARYVTWDDNSLTWSAESKAFQLTGGMRYGGFV